MFSPDIVGSDAFLDMPVSSQVLYFHLAMRADDDGFVTPKMVMRLIGSNNDDLKVLLTKRFLLPFESGVVVIKHWLIHNLIRADLYKETMYKKEKTLLGLNDNGAYTELREGVGELKQIEAPKWLKQRRKDTNRKRTVGVPKTALRLGKDRLGKDTIQATEAVAGEKPKFNPLGGEIIKEFIVLNPACGRFYSNTTQRGACDRLIATRGLEQVMKVIKLLERTNKISYLPTITTPLQLEEKWASLEAGLIKEKGKVTSQGKGIA